MANSLVPLLICIMYARNEGSTEVPDPNICKPKPTIIVNSHKTCSNKLTTTKQTRTKQDGTSASKKCVDWPVWFRAASAGVMRQPPCAASRTALFSRPRRVTVTSSPAHESPCKRT